MRLVSNEDTLQIYVKDLMDSPRADPRVVWFHVPNESKATVRHRVNMKRRGVLAGVSDCLFIMPSSWRCIVLLLELKNGTKGRHSDAQKLFRRRIEAMTGPQDIERSAYRIATTPAEIDAVLTAFGIVTGQVHLMRAAA